MAMFLILRVPEPESVQDCDAHRGKLGILAVFMESSEINPNKILLGSKLIIWQRVKNSQKVCP